MPVKYALAVAALAAGFVLAYLLRADPGVVAPTSRVHPARPGAAAPAAAQPVLAAGAPSPELLVDEQGALVVNVGLLRTIDHCLVDPGGGGMAALRQQLATRLRGSAYRAAERLGADYADYMRQYDQLLAAQNLRGGAFDALDLQRLASWARQRQGLRERVFGTEVARAWFDNDEAQLDHAIEALANLKGPPEGADVAPAEIDPRYAVSRQADAREEAARALALRRTIGAALLSFAERARDGETMRP